MQQLLYISVLSYVLSSHHLAVWAHAGEHGEASHHHEKVSLEQAKIRLQQLKDGKMMEDEKHIREHLQNIASIPEGEMTNEQRAFHFFYIHDIDQDNRLDGLEILHSIMESHDEEVKRLKLLKII